jgi:hypothetical protein
MPKKKKKKHHRHEPKRAQLVPTHFEAGVPMGDTGRLVLAEHSRFKPSTRVHTMGHGGENAVICVQRTRRWPTEDGKVEDLQPGDRNFGPGDTACTPISAAC